MVDSPYPAHSNAGKAHRWAIRHMGIEFTPYDVADDPDSGLSRDEAGKALAYLAANTMIRRVDKGRFVYDGTVADKPTRNRNIRPLGHKEYAPRDPYARPKVEQWFREHAVDSTEFTAADVASQLGMSEQSVSSAANRLARDGILLRGTRRGMFRLMPGQLTSRAAKPPAMVRELKVGTLVEVIGHTPDGDAIVRSESAIVYVIREVR